MSRAVKGDYIGFTFGDVHSSELGLVRVSDGSRYKQDLLPPLQDKSIAVNGRDGEVLFGTTYKAKEIKVPVAFDNLTEENFNRLKKLLADKKPKSLWFDETPYKEWIVKSATAQDFSWICFDETHNGKEARIYKGEGTLTFKCYSAYAQSRVTYLDDVVPYVYIREENQIVKKNSEYYITKSPNLREKMRIEDMSLYDSEGRKYEVSNLFDIAKEMAENGILGITKNNTTEDFVDDIFKIEFPLINEITQKPTSWLGKVYYVKDDFTINYGDQGFMAINLATQQEERIYYKSIEIQDRNGEYLLPLFFCEFEAEALAPLSGYVLLTKKQWDDDFEFLCPIPPTGNQSYTWKRTGLSAQIIDGHLVTLQDNYNFEEWKDASDLVFKEDRENFPSNSQGTINIYNSGDIEADFSLFIPSGWEQPVNQRITDKDGNILLNIDISKVPSELYDETEEDIIQIDSKLRLIRGLKKVNDQYIPNGLIYNKYITKGDFFKLQKGENYFTNAFSYFEDAKHKHYYI